MHGVSPGGADDTSAFFKISLLFPSCFKDLGGGIIAAVATEMTKVL